MGSEAVEVLKQVKTMWMSDFKKYLVPALELMVDLLIMMFTIMLLTIPLYFLSIPLVIFIDSQTLWISVAVIPFFILLYLLFFFLALIGRSIIDGGTVKVTDSLMRGEEYRFWDILRKGWAGKWQYMKLELSIMLVQMGIIYGFLGLVALLAIPLVILVIAEPLWVPILVMIVIVAFVVLLPISIFLIPLPFFSFSIHHREDKGAFRSVSTALKFMLHRKKDTFILGGVFYLVILIGSYIPGLGILVQSCANIFMYQCALLIFPEKKDRFDIPMFRKL